jgi:hypothetical protein
MAVQKEKSNPSNVPLSLPKGYKPMTGGTLRLEVPEKPGWHRHWFRGVPARLGQAVQAGYRYVDADDVDINNFDLAGDSKDSGNGDMGSRVSVGSGEGPTRMYLMECPDEIFEYAQSLLGKQSDALANTLKGGTIGSDSSGESGEDRKNRYIDKRTGKNSLFTRKS